MKHSDYIIPTTEKKLSGIKKETLEVEERTILKDAKHMQGMLETFKFEIAHFTRARPAKYKYAPCDKSLSTFATCKKRKSMKTYCEQEGNRLDSFNKAIRHIAQVARSKEWHLMAVSMTSTASDSVTCSRQHIHQDYNENKAQKDHEIHGGGVGA